MSDDRRIEEPPSDPAAIARMIDEDIQQAAVESAEEIRERARLEAVEDGIDHERERTLWQIIADVLPWGAGALSLGLLIGQMTKSSKGAEK